MSSGGFLEDSRCCRSVRGNTGEIVVSLAKKSFSRGFPDFFLLLLPPKASLL